MTRVNVYILQPPADQDAITVAMLRSMVANLDGCPGDAVVRARTRVRGGGRDGALLRQLVTRWETP